MQGTRPPPMVQAPPKAQKMTVSPGFTRWCLDKAGDCVQHPWPKIVSTSDASPRPQGVSGHKSKDMQQHNTAGIWNLSNCSTVSHVIG